MNYGLNDNTVKRIAAIAFHRKGGSAMANISGIYHRITHPEQQNELLNAHTTDAMQHKFANKDEENSFKSHIAKASSINRGTMDLVPEDHSNIMHENPTSSGSESV